MILEYNLQFFAKEGAGGEKTEPATEKKLKDARSEGQVAKSKEIPNALGILTLFLLVKFWVGTMGNQFLGIFEEVYLQMPDTVTLWNGYLPSNAIRLVFFQMLLNILIMIAPVLIIAFVIAFLGDLIQVQWKPSSKTLKPKFSKMNPISGFKKIISMNSLVELIKSIAKIGIIVLICYNYLNDKWSNIFYLYDMPILQVLQLEADILSGLGIQISVFYLVLALVDFGYQKFKFSKDMRMTKQEIKDEYKQQEGDPAVKGKIRGKMREVSRRRMMQNLPQADVVITNPTHFAVAIKYDAETAEAPVVLAKGADYLAAKIKEIAKENNIEIVENKPLARMLYANVEVGKAIPPELYQAVAEILAFVYHLKNKV